MLHKKQLYILLWLLALSLVLVGCGLSVGAVSKPPPVAATNELVVQVLDVGQADAILIRTPLQAVLVDAGDKSSVQQVLSALRLAGIEELDQVIITHAHADHVGGMSGLLDRIRVKQVYDSAFPLSTPTYLNYLLKVQDKQIPFAKLEAGAVVDLGAGINLQVLSPGKKFISGTNSDCNNNSLVLKLVYQDFSMLLTGDIEREAEQRLVKTAAAQLKSQVLKSPHHGSRTSSSPAFLQAVAPAAVIISVGAKNSYQHPHPTVIKRYQQANIKVYRTDRQGTITVRSDGKSYRITVKEAN